MILDLTIHDRTRSRSAKRSRGSILILVIVSLVLMAMMGTAYISVARMDRIATRQITSDNIDLIIAAAVSQIRDVLKDDNLDENGLIFNPLAGDESYDYPFTNPSVEREVVFGDGTTAAAKGGAHDDTWLASSSPEFDATQSNLPYWPHVTNPIGIFLDLPVFAGDEPMPVEYAVDHSDVLIHTDTGLSIEDLGEETTNFQAPGADADGDGIRDSRWTWAPIRQIGGVTYVMAVRIVDLSSMINVNAATATTSDGVTMSTNSAEQPRGYFPTGLDLSRLFARGYPIGENDWEIELEDLLKFRGFDPDFTLSAPIPLGFSNVADFPLFPAGSLLPDSRTDSWLNNTSYYGMRVDPFLPDQTVKFNVADELELRFKGGLVKVGSAEIDNIAPVLMRESDGDLEETSFFDVPGVDPDDDDATQISQFFQGGLTTDVKSREFADLRKWLTTTSGHTLFAPNFNNMHNGAPTLKYDLVYRHREDDGTYDLARVEEIRDRLWSATGMGVLEIGAPTYLGLVDEVELEKLATEFALAIQDYSDSDSFCSAYATSSGVTYYGMETLPFIREVYAQVGYDDKDLFNQGTVLRKGHPNFMPDNIFDTWVVRDKSEALVVELGNPFDRPLEISMTPYNTNPHPEVDPDKLRLQIKIGNAEATPLDATHFMSDDGPLTDITIEPNGRLIIYYNPQNPAREKDAEPPFTNERGFDLRHLGFTADQGDGDARVLIALDPNWGGVPRPFTFPLKGKGFTVALQVWTKGDDQDPTVDDGWATYDRFNLDGLDFAVRNIPHTFTPTPDQPWPTHAQGSVARDGRGIRYLSNDGKGLVTGALRLPDDSGYHRGAKNNAVDRLNQNDKTISGDSNLDDFQIPIANRPFFSVAELGHVFMFGFTNQTNGDFPHRFSGGDGVTAVADTRRFLDFDNTITTNIPDQTAILHASMLLDQFTTLSPLYDVVDNNNDDGDNDRTTSADDETEQVVPGTININTAPLHVLTLAAPLPESIDETEALMRQIIAYRDAVNGIRSVGQLMMVPPLAAPGDNSDIQRYGNNGVSDANTAVDLYPIPENANATRFLDLEHRPEESMARFQFLAQAFATRSDYYCAYVLVQGFPSSDFRLGPVESARFLAIFDRSNVTSADDTVRVLGFFKVPS